MTASMTMSSSPCVPAPRLGSFCWASPFSIRRVVRPAGRSRETKGVVMACASDGVSPLMEAAKFTVNTFVKNGMMIGLGSGPASCMVIHYLGKQLQEGMLANIVGIPSSVSSATEAAKAGIPLNNYQDSLQVDFAFDDADIVEEGTLAAIIGRRKLEGGESILEEKSIMNAARTLTFIVSEKQYTQELHGSVPVIIESSNWMETAEEIDDLFLGDAEVWRRPSTGYAGPLGGDFPLVTREGHHVLDVIFTSPVHDLAKVAEDLDQIDGVVDHGVVHGIPCTAIITSDDGLQVVNNLSMHTAKQM